MKGNKTKLTKRLDNLGKLSLKETVEHATASADTAEEAAQNLKDIIQPNERGKGEALIKGKRKALIKGKRRRSKTPGGQVPLMQPHCPKKGTTKADQLALGQ